MVHQGPKQTNKHQSCSLRAYCVWGVGVAGAMAQGLLLRYSPLWPPGDTEERASSRLGSLGQVSALLLREHPEGWLVLKDKQGRRSCPGMDCDPRGNAQPCSRPDSELGCAPITAHFTVAPAWLLLLPTVAAKKSGNGESWKALGNHLVPVNVSSSATACQTLRTRLLIS